jgi:uncharacterized protein YkwD
LLNQVADKQAHAMGQQGKLGSTNTGTLLDQAGFAWTALVENAATGCANFTQCTSGWMLNPTQRNNLFAKGVSYCGAGVFTKPGGSKYVALILASGTSPTTQSVPIPPAVAGTPLPSKMPFTADILCQAINQRRSEQAGLQPLTLSVRASQAAAMHAKELSERGVLTHIGQDGRNTGNRLDKAGVPWTRYSENLKRKCTTPQACVDEMHADPLMRNNMLSSHVTLCGAGSALDAKGQQYVVVDFFKDTR